MTLSELKILITGDDSSAQDAFARTSQSLQDAKEAAQALADKLADLRQETTLGENATDRQVTMYQALHGEFGQAQEAVKQLNQAYDQLDARTASDQAWSKFSGAMRQAQDAIAKAALQSRDDRNAFEIFGKTFAQLTPEVGAYISELGRAQIAAEKLAKAQPTGMGAAFSQIPQLSEKIAQAAQAQKELNAEYLKQVQTNAELIQLGGRGTEIERQLWEIQEGRFKALSPMMKAVLELQTKLIQQSQDQAKLDQAMRAAQLQHAKLTATTAEEKAAVDLLGKSCDQLTQTQKDQVANGLTPLLEANQRLEESQRRQAEIGQELNRQLARQYADIARAGSALGPLDDLLKSILLDTTKLTPENQKLLDQIKRMQPAVDAFQSLSKGVKTLFDGLFQDLFQNGFKGFFSNVIQGFQKMLADMAQEWAKSQLAAAVQRGLVGLFGGGGSALGGLDLTDGFGTFLATGLDFSPLDFLARASGGPVNTDQPYLVGEDGPELFVPANSGSVLSNGQMQSALSPNSVTIHNHFQIQTPNPDAFRRSVGQLATETGLAIRKHVRRNL